MQPNLKNFIPGPRTNAIEIECMFKSGEFLFAVEWTSEISGIATPNIIKPDACSYIVFSYYYDSNSFTDLVITDCVQYAKIRLSEYRERHHEDNDYCDMGFAIFTLHMMATNFLR